jgi:hypothetical protein
VGVVPNGSALVLAMAISVSNPPWLVAKANSNRVGEEPDRGDGRISPFCVVTLSAKMGDAIRVSSRTAAHAAAWRNVKER